MDDRYLDNLIEKTLENNVLNEMPPEDFFIAIARRGIRRRRIRILTKVAAAACFVVVAGGVFLYLHRPEEIPSGQSIALNAIFLESENLVDARFERHGLSQQELRASIDNEIPLPYNN